MILSEIIPSHDFALWIMKHINMMLDLVGISNNPVLDQILYVTAFVIVGIVLGLVIKKIVVFAVKKFVALRHSAIARQILQEKLLLHCSHVIPPVVIMAMIPFALSTGRISAWLMKILVIYTIIVFGIAISAILTFVWNRYNDHENTRNLPLKGILNTAKGILWLIAAIIIVSVIIDKSPGALLAGLGAFAAALMLIFKDSILGFTAGIQLALNDMVHVGDWIVVPSTPANGTVMDVSLTAVKVRNFDNTIVTCPPYTLVSTSFQNYRGMTESGCRRIARSVIFDFSSIVPITRDKAAEIASKLPLLQDFVAKAGEQPVFDPGQATVNGTIDTNLGLFRAYVKMWLDANQHVAHDSDCFVSTLAQTASGIPFQIYCFTNTSAWFAYEAIQDSILEHVAAMLNMFQLYTFENPSGRDTVIEGYLSQGNIDPVYGVPYPFFQNPNAPHSPASTRVVPKIPPTA